MNKIIKNDKVIVITGKNKGAIGKVLQVFPKKNRIIVEGVNVVKKRVKNSENPNNYVEKELSIHVSNVSLIDPKTEKPIKVGFTFKDKIKIRVNRKTGEQLSS